VKNVLKYVNIVIKDLVIVYSDREVNHWLNIGYTTVLFQTALRERYEREKYKQNSFRKLRTRKVV
jgi:hypothetical protein